MALARDPEPLPVVDPGRNLDVERPLGDLPPLTVAIAARVLDDASGALAPRAHLRVHELAERRLPNLLKAAGAVADRTVNGSGSRLRAAAPARLADDGDGEPDLARHSVRGLDEVDLDIGGDVAAAPPARTRDAEEIVAEEGREEVGDVAEVEVGGPVAARPQAGMP